MLTCLAHHFSIMIAEKQKACYNIKYRNNLKDASPIKKVKIVKRVKKAKKNYKKDYEKNYKKNLK